MASRSTLVAALLLACASPAVGTTLHVTAPQLFRIADAALSNGDQATARRALRALMDDPSPDVRLEARFRLAIVESKTGKLRAAATLLREVVDQRPSAERARLELAGVLDRLGDKDGAWRQVRAIHAGGLPPEVARLVDRYSEGLRAQRLFGASFEIALAPDSNINRATGRDTLGTVLGDFQIADDGKAKSGTGPSLSAQAYRRLSLGSDASLLLRAAGFANLYQRTEFNDLAADLAAGPEFQLGRGRVQIEVGATQRWFGQKPYSRSVRVAGTLAQPVGRTTMARLGASAGLVDNQINNLQKGKNFSAQLAVEQALSAITGLTASVGIDRQSLRDPGYSTTGWRAGVNVWHDFGRVTLTAGADLGRLRADERLMLFPDKRSDRYYRLSLGAAFRELNWRGFAPVARFSMERNRSNIAFYDYRRTRTEIGVVHAF